MGQETDVDIELETWLGAWIDRWRGPLTGLLYSWGARRQDAIDIAQDVFAEAWMARARFDGDLGDPSRVGPWLRGIGFNLFCTWQRREERKPQFLREVEEKEAAAAREVDEDPAVEHLRREVERLPSKERTVIWMHYLEEADVAEVAGLLGVSVRTVEGRLYRGRRTLRERLTETERGASA